MRRLFLSALFLAAIGAAVFVGVKRFAPGPRVVVIDLADRLPFAARTGSRDFIALGWPDAEPHLISGFGGDPETRGRERFQWVREGATFRVNVAEPKDRALIFDLEAYKGIEDQALAITVNGKSLGLQEVTPARSRVRFDWPASAQEKENDLILRFAKSVVPGSGDTRDLAAAIFSVTIGDPADPSFDLLRERETPHEFGISEIEHAPAITLPGGTQTSFAFRLPEKGALEFEASLHPWSIASGGKGLLKVSIDSTDGSAVSSIEIPLATDKPQARSISLKGAAGTPTMVTFAVSGEKPGLVFANVRAPRITSNAPASGVKATPAPSTLAAAFAQAKPNVLLIVLDASRAVSFGTYGHPRSTTPNIDGFAKDGFAFENAYTTAVYTLAAMSSVWTSQPPDRHHGDVAFSAPLPKDRLTLAEVLTAQGVHTAGFVANAVAGAQNGFDRGFREFTEPWKKTGSQATSFRNVLPEFFDRMKTKGAPFFAYVHYREPHHPYDPPPPYNAQFGPDAPIPKSQRGGGPATEKWLKDRNQGVIVPSAEEIDHLRRLYDGNLAFADHEIGWLRDELKARGLLDNTLVIITGDHGEALFEHGYIGHNAQVFEESAHIPLIVSLPAALRAANPPRRVKALVDSTDIAPTILESFGLSGQGGTVGKFQGRSLIPFLGKDAGPDDPREVLTRTVWDTPTYALRDASHTFVYSTKTTELSLFDRTASPRREDKDADFAPRAPIALREMYRQHLLAWVAAQRKPAVDGGKAGCIDPDQCEQMKALGYLDAKTVCRTAPCEK